MHPMRRRLSTSRLERCLAGRPEVTRQVARKTQVKKREEVVRGDSERLLEMRLGLAQQAEVQKDDAEPVVRLVHVRLAGDR